MAQETVTSFKYSTDSTEPRGTGGYRQIQITQTQQKVDKRQNLARVSLKL